MTLALAVPSVAHRAVASVVAGAGGGLSGLEAWGVVGGLIGGVAAAGALFVTVRAQARSNEMQRARERQDDFDRGSASREPEITELRSDRDYWRSLNGPRRDDT